MHVYFSGIGGSGMSSLALLAKRAGYKVSGSDAADSATVSYLKSHGVNNIHIGQSEEQIAAVHKITPIDWLVHTLAISDAGHPEVAFCAKHNIRVSSRDEFLKQVIKDHNLELIAVAGTHGKSTTTAMAIWLFKQLGLPISYCLGAKIGFGESGDLEPASKYFIYEADEFGRSFLSFYPKLSLISGIDWDHPDVYPTRESYLEAFSEFIEQSVHSVLWLPDAEQLNLSASPELTILDQTNPNIDRELRLAGRVNREDAWMVAQALTAELGEEPGKLTKIINNFPGLSRRFEQIAPNVYSDYAHTPPKIRGALQMAHEVGGDNIVVVYEGLHNTRQHFIKEELANLFDDVKKLYIVPSFLAREDKALKLLSPADILNLLSKTGREHSEAAKLDSGLLKKIKDHASSGDTVLCLSAGGAGSLDEWLRQNLAC